MKSHNPTTLKDAMNLTRDFENMLPKTKYPPKPNFPSKLKDGRKSWKKDSFVKYNIGGPSKEELIIKKLCFTCQKPWVAGHKCEKGKAHYIEVFSEDEEDGEEEEAQLAAQEEGYNTI